MRTLMLFLLAATTSFSQTTPSGYDLIESSREYIQDLYRCKRNPQAMGCTMEKKMALAQIEGKVHDVNSLNEVLKNDIERGYFVPLSINNERLLALAAATSLGLVVFASEQQISDYVSSRRSAFGNTIQDIGNFLGETAIFPIAAGSYFLGLYYEDDRLVQAGIFTVGASLAMGLVTAGVKYATGRVRPNEGRGPYQFWEFGNKSFYSGHTAQAFTIATVFAELYKEDYPVVPYIAYGLATLTAYARVYGQDHWASDVLVGAIAGHLITKWTMKNYKDFMIYPVYNRATDQYMIIMSFEIGGNRERNPPSACRHIENQYARVEACIDEALNKGSQGRRIYIDRQYNRDSQY